MAEVDGREVKVLWADVQFLDFTTAPGKATLWDEQDDYGSRIPVKLGVAEEGTVFAITIPR